MRSPSPFLPLLLATTAGALCTGCIHVSTANDQAIHSDGAVMPSALPPSDTPTYTTPDAPSLTGLDRSAWPVTFFTVAQRDVEHQTLYRSRPISYTHTSAVQRGEYPTAENAGEDVTNGSRQDQALEGLVAPINAAGEVVMLIPRAIMARPTTPARGPTSPVERVPRSSALPAQDAANPPTRKPVPPPEVRTKPGTVTPTTPLGLTHPVPASTAPPTDTPTPPPPPTPTPQPTPETPQ